MPQTNDRAGAADLARRLAHEIDPAKIDESRRPPGDRPPGFADALMSEEPVPADASKLTSADWDLIRKALEHYAACTSG